MSGCFILISGPGKTRKQCNTHGYLWMALVVYRKAGRFLLINNFNIVGRSCAAQKVFLFSLCVCACVFFVFVLFAWLWIHTLMVFYWFLWGRPAAIQLQFLLTVRTYYVYSKHQCILCKFKLNATIWHISFSRPNPNLAAHYPSHRPQ